MKINQQIIDTFAALDSDFNRISGLSFDKILINNGITSNILLTITENSVTGGIYHLSFTPNLTGNWYVYLYNPQATFDAYYYIDYGSISSSNNIWTDSGTSVLNNIQITGVTASINYVETAKAMWSYPITGDSITSGSMGQTLTGVYQILTGKWNMENNQLKLYDIDGISIIKTFNLYDLNGNSSLTGVVRREPVL